MPVPQKQFATVDVQDRKPIVEEEDDDQGYTLNFGTVKTLDETPNRGQVANKAQIMIDFTPSPHKFSSHQ